MSQDVFYSIFDLHFNKQPHYWELVYGFLITLCTGIASEES
jgi:hypothetical protein